MSFQIKSRWKSFSLSTPWKFDHREHWFPISAPIAMCGSDLSKQFHMLIVMVGLYRKIIPSCAIKWFEYYRAFH
jgi:hypothetical protein